MTCDFLHFEEVNYAELSSLYEQGWFKTAFHTPEYWKIITENNWQLLIVSEQGTPIAVMPLQEKRKYLLKYYWQPPFMLYANPIVLPFSYKNNYQKFSRLRKIYTAFADFLTKYFKFFYFQCVPNFYYLLPFAWKKITISLRTTFIIDKLEGRKQYSPVLRRKLLKAEEKFSVTSNKDWKIFLDTYANSNKNFLNPFRQKILRHLLASNLSNIKQKNAVNSQGEIVASAIFLQGKQEDYYLLGTQRFDIKETAIGLLLEQAIQESSAAGKRFNFEGSHIEPIERFFRSFGAIPTTYPTLKKTFFFL